MGDDEERDEVNEERESDEVNEERESDEQATEQRTDDYDGIVRRLDELRDELRGLVDEMRRGFDAMGLAVESAGYVDASIDASEVAEGVAEAIDELVGLEALDLL